MQRALWIVLLAALLAGCAGPQPGTSPTPASVTQPTRNTALPTASAQRPAVAPTQAEAAAPTFDATAVPPTARPIDSSATVAPAPTAAPATHPPDATAAPAPATVIPTTVAPAGASAPLPDTPLDTRAQVRALLPEFAGDLGRAGEWNRYTISAAIDQQARTIAGRERVEYTNRDSVTLDRLYFHLYPNLRDFAGSLTVSALTVDGQPRPVAYERQHYLLRVGLPQPLAPGAATTVTFDFRTAAPENASADRSEEHTSELQSLRRR